MSAVVSGGDVTLNSHAVSWPGGVAILTAAGHWDAQHPVSAQENRCPAPPDADAAPRLTIASESPCHSAHRRAEEDAGQKLVKPLDSVSEVGYGGVRQKAGKQGKTEGENGKLARCNGTTLAVRRRAPVPAVPNGPLVISAGWGRTGTSSLKVMHHTAIMAWVNHQTKEKSPLQ